MFFMQNNIFFPNSSSDISCDISRLRRVCLPGPLLDGDDRPDVRAGPEDLLRVVVQQIRLYCHHRQCIRGKEDAAH